MTGSAISLHDFIDTASKRIPYIHPAAEFTVYQWFAFAREAADRDDAAEIARLLDAVRQKVVLELRWQADDAETGLDYRAAYRLRRRADRIEVPS
jgi:hypothetical protein